jgi:hypothetical protein
MKNKGYRIESIEDIELSEKDALLEDIEELNLVVNEENVKKTVKKKYFGSATEKKILEYINETNDIKRDQIFNKYIYPKLYKMAEGIIFSFGFNLIRNEKNSIEELKKEVISDIIIKGFPTFTANRGRAFSYFSKIVINYLIRKLKYEKRYINITDDENEDNSSNNININTFSDKAINLYDNNEEIYNQEYIKSFRNYLIDNEFNIAKNVRELRVIQALIEIFEDGKYQIMNITFKKQFYDLIKDYCPDLSTFQIKGAINIIKDYYESFKIKYINNEV